MKIAVEGCAHGELEKIYECIETLQEREGITVDMLICCGDFQSVRNSDDLRAMAVPEKYQNMCSFYKYYSGEKRAPILTLFIGGNHEASNYLQELPYGGWVAPNIYYLGRSGVVRFGDLRIGGLSGIFKGHDYLQGLWECPPYTQNSLRSVYHIRSFDVFRLSQLKDKVHVMLSHDWPTGITDYGDVDNLLRRKPFFSEDIESKRLGSPPAEKLLHKLKPDYWFAAHLHCQFAALVKHEGEMETKFLALDKCLPKRRHLQILDLPSEYDGDKLLKYDAEWLAILKSTNHLMTVKNVECHMPGPGGDERHDFTPTKEEKDVIVEIMKDMTMNEDSFVKTAPVYKPGTPKRAPSEPIMNPQTINLCEKLGIDDPVQIVMARTGREMKQANVIENVSTPNTPMQNPVVQSPITRLLQHENFSTPKQSPVVRSPKTKLLLPEPVTPSDNCDEVPERDSFVSTGSSFLSESTCSTTVECGTPVSTGVKKTFKRRNVAMYTPDADESVSTASSSLDADSPRTSKLTCRDS